MKSEGMMTVDDYPGMLESTNILNIDRTLLSPEFREFSL